MRGRRRGVSFGALLSSAFAAVSCASDHGPSTSNACTTTADCAGALVCDATQHVCVSPTPNAVQVVLVGVPPNGQPTAHAATTAQAPLQISGNHTTADVSLQAPCVVYGAVQGPATGSTGGTPAQQISAALTFHLEGATPAQTDVSVTASAMSTTMTNGRQFAYAVALPAGTYDVTVQPSDGATYPPFFLPPQTITCTDGFFPLTILYAMPTLITGRIVDVSSGLPVPAVRVQIVDPAQDDRVISSVVQTASPPSAADPTGPASGSFALALATGATEQWALQVISQPTVTTAGVASGRLVYQIDRTHLGADASYTGLSLSAPAVIGLAGAVAGTCVACVDVSASVQATASDGTRIDLVGATVDLHASDVVSGLTSGSFSWVDAQATTGTDGMFHAQLLPGTYTATITPTQGSGFAITQTTLSVTARGLQGPVLVARQLVPVVGRVLNGTQETMPAMAGATIEAIPIPPLVGPDDPPPLPAREAQAVTDTTGQYRLALDEGSYAFVIHPPDGAGFATQILSPVTVTWSPTDTAMITPRQVSEGDVTIAAPFAVMGVVKDGRAAPLPGATVRAYVRYPQAGGAPFDVEIGRATAGMAGQYTLLMSSQVM